MEPTDRGVDLAARGGDGTARRGDVTLCRSGGAPRRGDRGVSVQINYITSLGITTILMVTLVMTTGTFVDNQTERAASHELEAIGNRIAGQIGQADDLAARGGHVSMKIHQPREVVGRSYSVRLGHGPECSSPVVGTDDCLLLQTRQPAVTVTVPVVNTTDVDIHSAGRGTFRVTARPSGPVTTTSGGGSAGDLDMTAGVGKDVGVGAGNGSDLNLANNQPVAKFTFEPGAPVAGWKTNFTSHSSDPDGDITTYEWDLNGDGNVERTGQSFDYSYTNPGRYNATLTVTDDNGVEDSESKMVVVGGLVYEGDAQARNFHGNGKPGGLTFNVTNVHGDSVEIVELYVDPADDDISKFQASSGGSKGGRPIFIERNPGTYVTGGGAIDLYDDGVIVDLDAEGPPPPVLASGDRSEIALSEFYEGTNQRNMTGEPVTIGLRYHIVGEDDYYVSKFDVTDTYNAPPSPDFDVTCTDRECEFDASASSDADGSITDYQWQFGDGDGATGEIVDHEYSSNGTYTVTLTVTNDNGTSASASKSVTVGGVAFDLSVNFQPDGTAVPPGYLEDNGDAYGSRGNGHTYGWVKSPGGPATDAKATDERSAHGDQKYDTLNHMDGSKPWAPHDADAWEVDVPDARYRVYVAMGDPSYTDQENAVDIEGTVVDDPDGEDNHDRYAATVEVTDGRLTIAPAPGSDNAKIQFVEIEAVDEQRFSEDGGQVVLEAEHFQGYEQGNDDDDGNFPWDSGDDMEGHAWWRVDDSDASSGRALEVTPDTGDAAEDTENGPRLDYEIYFTTTDTYYVWARMNCPDGGADAVHAGLDGDPESYDVFDSGGLSDGCSSTNGWTWVNRANGDFVTLDVTSTGVHTVNVWANEDGTMIDKIVVTADPTYSPSGEGPDESDRK